MDVPTRATTISCSRSCLSPYITGLKGLQEGRLNSNSFLASIPLLDHPDRRPESLAEDIDALVGRLKAARQCTWGVQEFKREDDFMVELCRQVLIPLFGDVVLEKRYSSKVGSLAGASAHHLGMGTNNTWHGMADLRIGSCCILTTDEVMSEEEGGSDYSDSEQEPPPMSDLSSMLPSSPSSVSNIVNFEGKVQIRDCNTDQLAATAVTASFNLYLQENALVPTVIINSKGFKVCLYDSVNDVLPLSNVKNLVTGQRLSRSGLLLLWILVHHRYQCLSYVDTAMPLRARKSTILSC